MEPLRMCVVTRMLKPKTELLRFVKVQDKILIDKKQKLGGRGVWVSRDTEVLAKLEKTKILNKVFKTNIDPSLYQEAQKLCQN